MTSRTSDKAEQLLRLHAEHNKKRKFHPVSRLQNTLRLAVLDTGLSNRELARLTGYDKDTVGDLVTGKRGGTLQTWSNILDAAEVEVGTRRTRSTS